MDYITTLKEGYDVSLGFDIFKDAISLGNLANCEETYQQLFENSVAYDELAKLEVSKIHDYRLVPKENRNIVIIKSLFIVEKDTPPSDKSKRHYFKSFASALLNEDQKIMQLQRLNSSYEIVAPLKLYDKRMNFDSDYLLSQYLDILLYKEYITDDIFAAMSTDKYVYASYSYSYSVGCQHYICGAELQCSTCKGFFSCRFCHENCFNSIKLMEQTAPNTEKLSEEEKFHASVLAPQNEIITLEDRKNITYLDFTKTQFLKMTNEECNERLMKIEEEMHRRNDVQVNTVIKIQTENSSNEDICSGEEDQFDSFCMTGELEHEFKKKETEYVRCCFCRQVQKPSEYCTKCRTQFASYYCGECRLYSGLTKDAKPNKHCDGCGHCMVMYQELTTHCDKCKKCISTHFFDQHKCNFQSENDEVPCVICGANTVNGRYRCVTFPCEKNHNVHLHCYKTYIDKGNYKCPVCRRLIITGSRLLFFNIKHYEAIKFPKELLLNLFLLCDLICNECNTKFCYCKNFFGSYRCPNQKCQSFNVTVCDEYRFIIDNDSAEQLQYLIKMREKEKKEYVQGTIEEQKCMYQQFERLLQEKLLKYRVSIFLMNKIAKKNEHTVDEVAKFIEANEDSQQFKELSEKIKSKMRFLI